jgi:hypothetical protein
MDRITVMICLHPSAVHRETRMRDTSALLRSVRPVTGRKDGFVITIRIRAVAVRHTGPRGRA